ncbi:MAG: CheR family methyltransferase [Candidatus Acidiferrales bacterium]
MRSNSETQWFRLSDFVRQRLGLHFPPERWPDLERGVTAAARQAGVADVEDYVEWLLESPLARQQTELLASHLTVGETYFFREPHTFRILEEQILPELVQSRRSAGKRLRIWSAGCATGEEPYSIAISLFQELPDRADWNLTILASDINPAFLDKAAKGVYKDWSFRDVSPELKDRYFRRRQGGGWEVLKPIKQMLTFSYLNLADDVYPSLVNNTNAMDIVFCRNVLMYFAPACARQVVAKLYRSLAEGGWLICSRAECSQELYSQLVPVCFSGVTLYRKDSYRSSQPAVVLSPTEPAAPPGKAPDELLTPERPTSLWPHTPAGSQSQGQRFDAPESPSSPYEQALALYRNGHYADAAELLATNLADSQPDAVSLALLARAGANCGQLDAALAWCRQAVAADRLNAGLHFLEATILQEKGAIEEAASSLSKSLYLAPDFVLAHFALGHLALRQGKLSQAGKSFDNALALLRTHSPTDILSESEGITAGRLVEIIQSTNHRQRVAG